MTAHAKVAALVRDVLTPLVEADGGAIELVEASEERVVFRLGKACAGCPGAQFTQADVLEPAVRALLGPGVEIRVLRT